MKLRRRHLLLTGGATLGLGVLGYGGSVAVCSTSKTVTAKIIRPLFVAIGDILEPEIIGRAWLSRIGTRALHTRIHQRTDLLAATLIPDPAQRRAELSDVIRRDFARDETEVVENWVVSEAEAIIASAWVS